MPQSRPRQYPVPAARRPVLSVVVAAYLVADYLPQCLDSILADPVDDAALEIIVVDDASPDRGGQLLDGYAARYPQVRVLHLRENAGLGGARNAGLDLAAGDYVWFIDGDDWLPSGSVQAVLERLGEHRPDVLLLNHVRVPPDGSAAVDASNQVLDGVLGVVSIQAKPRLLRLQHTAWNKVIRRQFLVDLGLRFYPGWYEDVPFSNPLLIGAEKIAVLDRVCYNYRLGRAGAITATPDVRHFDAFDQYERLMSWATRYAVDQWIYAELFSLMISHYLVILGNDGRLSPGMRRAFFQKASEHYRRFLPPHSYPRPTGAMGLKHRLLRARVYLAYVGLRQVYRLATRGDRTPARGPRG